MASSSLNSPVQDAICSVLYNTQGPKVNVKEISQDLFRENLIDFSLRQYILSQQTDDRAQDILAQHLFRYGTLESIRRLCAVLRRTASSYPSHLLVAERLEQACGLPSASMNTRYQPQTMTTDVLGLPQIEANQALTPMAHNIENQELSESEIAKIFESAFSPLKSIYYKRLPAVPPKVDCPKLGYVELVVIDRGEERRRNKAQISDFLYTTMQGIDAVLKRVGSISYDGILKFDDEFDVPPTGRRVVISGAPGCGKSTLSRHLCTDLSTGHLSNTYQLIVLVELRELAYRLQEGEQLQLVHLLFKYESLRNKKVQDAIYKCRGRNILFILDGYDELDESLRSCQFLKLILPACSPTYLNECDVIVTTRPVTCGELFNMVGNPHRHIEILGFKREHIYEYIDKYFVKLPLEQPSCQKLKAKLKQLPHVEGMCRVPVVLEIVCKVYRILGECSIPETQTGIFQKYMISELIGSKDGQKIKVADLLSVSEEDFPGFSELCEKAFKCCSKKEQRLLLTEQDVGSLKDYVKRGSMYGLLFAEAIDSICEGGNVCIYYFLHKSIQEMLAAVHIGKLPEDEHEALWKKQFGRPEMAEIWKYYAGITSLKKLKTDFIQEMCSKNSKKDDQKMLLAISLFEASNKDVAAKILPQIFPNGCISAKAGSSYEITVLNYCVRNHPSVTSVNLAGNRSIKFGEPLKDLMSTFNSLQHLDLSLLSQEDWKILYASILPGNRITSVSLGQVPVEVLTKIVSECNCLEKLTIKGMIKANMRKGFAAEVCKVISGSGSLNCVKFILSKSCKMSDTEIQGVVSAIVSGLIGATQTSSSVSKAVGPPLEKNTACKAKMVEVLHSCTRRETFLQCCTGGDEYKFVAPIVQAVLKGLPSYNKQQTVMIRCVTCYNQESINGDESWISSQPELVVPCIKCQLELCLTPEEWYAILCGVVDAEDLEELDVSMKFSYDRTPVNEEELCDAWSKCKCKTVNVKFPSSIFGHDSARYFVTSVFKGMSINRHVQHLSLGPYCHETASEYQDCLYSLKKLLISRVKCALNLELSPVVWSAILCGVGDAEDLEELDVTLWFSNDQTQVNEEELCDAWSKCKCKTVNVEIGLSHKTPIMVSLLTAVLKGVARSKASVDFKLTCSSWYSNIGYFVQGIPKNVLNYFTRSGDTFTLKPLENRLSSADCSSNGEPPNKRLHIENQVPEEERTMPLDCIESSPQAQHLNISSPIRSPLKNSSTRSSPRVIHAQTPSPVGSMTAHSSALLERPSLSAPISPSAAMSYENLRNPTSGLNSRGSLHHLSISPGPQQSRLPAVNTQLDPSMSVMYTRNTPQQTDTFSWGGTQAPAVTLSSPLIAVSTHCGVVCTSTQWLGSSCSPHPSSGQSGSSHVLYQHRQIHHNSPTSQSACSSSHLWIGGTQSPVQRPPPAEDQPGLSSRFTNPQNFAHYHPYPSAQYRDGHTHGEPQYHPLLEPTTQALHSLPRLMDTSQMVGIQAPAVTQPLPLFAVSTHRVVVHPSTHQSGPSNSPHPSPGQFGSSQVYSQHRQISHCPPTFQSACSLRTQSPFQRPPPAEDQPGPSSYFTNPQNFAHYYPYHSAPHRDGHTHGEPQYHHFLEPTTQALHILPQLMDTSQMVGTQPPAVTLSSPVAVSTHHVVVHPSTHQSGYPYSPHPSPGQFGSSQVHSQRRQISYCPPTSQSACSSRTQSPVQRPPPAEDQPGPSSRFTHPQNLTHYHPYPSAQYRDGHAHGKF